MLVSTMQTHVRKLKNLWHDIHTSSALLTCIHFTCQHWILSRFLWKKQTWRIIINLFKDADSVWLNVYAEFYLFCIPHIHTKFRDLQCYFVLRHFLFSDRLQFRLQFSKLCRNNHHILLKFVVNTKEWEWSSKVLKCKDALFIYFCFSVFLLVYVHGWIAFKQEFIYFFQGEEFQFIQTIT